MEMEADWNRNCSSDIVRGSRITALENRERERAQVRGEEELPREYECGKKKEERAKATAH